MKSIISEKSLAVGLAIVAIAGIVLASSDDTDTLLNDNNKVQAQQQERVQQQQGNNTIRVEAGGGNSTAPLTVFVPQRIEIKAEQSVNWYNPTPVGEPHSVTFIKDNRLFPPFAAPFSVSNSTEFKALIPSPNVEPLIVPNPPGAPATTSKTVIVDNARAYNPVVIDSTGKNITYLPLNANYTMDGTESYLNSGWIWPQGQVRPGPPPITTFTVTFENPGIYDYVCTVHPWMTGSIVVE
jgi:plastocyanin